MLSKTTNTALSIIHVNLQSSYRNYGILKAHLDLLKINFNIICISEAGPGNWDRCANIFGNDYIYDYNPPVGKKGGVAIYIKKELSSKKRPDLEIKGNNKIDNLWYEIMLNGRPIVTSVIYQHPGYKYRYLQ